MTPDEKTALLNRLSRAEGQLGGIRRMIEAERDVDTIIHQLKAVTNALERTGYAVVMAEMRTNFSEEAINDPEMQRLEKLFLSLS